MDLRSGCAIWSMKNGLIHSYAALTNELSCDVASGSTHASTGACSYHVGAVRRMVDERVIRSAWHVA